MHRTQKPVEVASLKERFQKAKALVFAENRGLKVSQITDLRKRLRKEKALIKTVKNRLVKRALKEAAITGLDEFFEGPVTVTSSEMDPVAAAKILIHFIKELEEEKLVIKGGYMDGAVLSPDKIKSLASLPSKEELYAKLLACMLNPARGLVSVLAAVPRQLVTVVDAVRKQKES